MIASWVDAGGPLGANATHYTTVATQLFSLHCDSCHSTSLSGGARMGAPTDVNTNTYAAASAYRTSHQSVAKRCNATTQVGSMPPAGQLSTPLRALHQAWIDSGWPN